ncbi:hypothetical protein PQX77_014522 [Marasmius sp. AFHP31]|nr:hypothetical protein PQX77_014522 [Marasmius sp. AFHP31]
MVIVFVAGVAPNQRDILRGSHRGGQELTTEGYEKRKAELEGEKHGKTYRRIIDGDLVLRRQLSSKVISVAIKPESGGGILTLPESQVVQVRKTKQTATVVGVEGTFTVTTYEPAGESNDGFESVLECILKAATSLRSPFLTQLFAFSGSNLSAMIAHDELADGHGYVDQSWETNQIVYYYLRYTYGNAIEALRDDDSVVFMVANRWRDWSVNLKTFSWQYDPASVVLDPPSEDQLVPFYNHFPPLCQDTVRRLDTAEIVACVEETLGDVLCLVASSGWRWDGDLSSAAKHGFLTLGVVVDGHTAEILAHFPSTPPLELFCESNHPGVKVSFSNSVPWRVDFSFRKTGDFQVNLDFGWRIRERNHNQHRTAFLCQSLPFLNNREDARKVVYVDQVGFTLKATLHHNPTISSKPTYLFVPPLPIKIINNMNCVPYPPPQPLFFWSHDPQGKEAIAEENWEELGILKLELRHWVGSHWFREEYDFVYNHLILRDYDWDGREYAREHDYPELIYGDPYDVRSAEVQAQEFDFWSPSMEGLSTIHEEDNELATGK